VLFGDIHDDVALAFLNPNRDVLVSGAAVRVVFGVGSVGCVPAATMVCPRVLRVGVVEGGLDRVAEID